MSELKDKPLITFALFTYNQERFIAEAVQGALSQSYSPLEIIISDDCSQDRTFDIINSVVSSYKGDHRIIIRRNESNLGVLAHINEVMEIVNGDLIVGAAGDDISFPDRVAHIVDIWRSDHASVIWSNAVIIDKNGLSYGPFYAKAVPRIISFDDVLTGKSPVAGAMCAWEKQVFDIFGPLSGGAINEDVMIPFRGALIGKIRYIDELLVYYRKHDANLSFFMKVSSSSVHKLIDLNIKNQKNTLMNCIEFKQILEKGKEAGILNIDYERANEILDERISLLVLEIQLFSQNFWLRLGTFMKNRKIVHGPNKIIKFLLIVASPTLFAIILKKWYSLKSGRRW